MLYQWAKAQDETYTIFNVDIFSQHGEGLRDYEITDGEVRNCTKKLQQKQKSGYLAPVHQEHFGQSLMGDDNKHRIGYLCNPKSTKNNEYGETLTVDFIGISEEDFQQIQAGKWPYRSIEGYFDPERPEMAEVFSLALMESAPPFFKYNLLYLEPQSGTAPGISVYDVLTASDAEREQELVTACQGINKDFLYSEIKRRFQMTEENKTGQPDPAQFQDDVPIDTVPEPGEMIPDAEEVPAWAQEIMGVLGEIKEALGLTKEEQGEGDKPEDKEDDKKPEDEKMSVAQATEMAELIAGGYSQTAALKMAKAGIKYSEVKKGEVKIGVVKPTTKAQVKQDDWDWEKNRSYAGFAGLSKDEYVARMQQRAHLYFPQQFMLDENGNVIRRVK